MKRRLVLLWLLLVAPAWAADDAGARYQALLATAKQASGPVDWQALRFAYADSPLFDLLGTQTAPLRKQMFEVFHKGDFAGAVTQAGLVLDRVYVDIDAHIVCDLAHQKLGNTALAKRHHDAVVGLLESISTGDGQTPATAFTVITVAEEYGAMRAFGVRVTGQSLVRQDGHAYDKLDGVDLNGQSRSYYFLIDRVLAAEAEVLKPKR